MKNFSLLLCFALSLVACDRAQQEFSSKDIKDVVEQLQSGSQLSVDELKKLQQIEYHVETLPSAVAPMQLEGKLSELGSDRWDCFEILQRKNQATDSELLITCKRPVKTPLRWIPRTIVNH